MEAIEMGRATVQKDLIALPSGNSAEAIYFSRPEKQVVCMSSQLNCVVGCAFCASPGPDKTTNLTTDEILYQIDEMMKYSETDNIILFSFMGEGEPLLNYKNVIAAIYALPKKYSNCKISLSTSGAAPDKIMDLANENFGVPFKLQVSLHSLDPETRNWFMPLAKDIDTIKKTIDFYHANNDGPVELNFALLEGVNDSLDDAKRIIKMFPNEHIKISQFNPIERNQFESANPETIAKFVKELEDASVSVEYHATDGSGIGAACGQTRGMRKI